MCANNNSQKEFDYTLGHELIHFYDDVRAEVDYSDANHIACGEIRATNLSGECNPAKA